MPTYTQYTNNYGGYASASQTALNSKIPLFKDYIQFRSGDDEYVLVIGTTDDFVNWTDVTVYTVETDGTYTLTAAEYDSCTTNCSNFYYTYNSNNNHFYNEFQRNQALVDSLLGFSLSAGVIICVILCLLRRLRRH